MQHIRVPASEWVGFSTLPGLGTESAYFGLARYPTTFRRSGNQSQVVTHTKHRADGTIEPDPSPIAEPAEEVIVDVKGWSSSSVWCKTQYANRHGLDHFLHCHLALINVLDYAKELGILERVNDDGGYWGSRSADVLVANLAENDRVVAAIVGSLHDLTQACYPNRRTHGTERWITERRLPCYGSTPVVAPVRNVRAGKGAPLV